MSHATESGAPLEAQESSAAESVASHISPSSPMSNYQKQAAMETGYSSFFQTDATSMLRTMNDLERKLRDVHLAPQWLSVVFAKLKKLDELEEAVHKLQLTTPVDTLDELFRNQNVERYSNMLKDEYMSKEGTVASELFARVQALELEQERLQKLLAARPTVMDMQVLKDLHAEHYRSLERQCENSHSGLQAQLQGLFAAELEEFHKWRQSQEVMLHSKFATMQSDMGSLNSARDMQRAEMEELRQATSETLAQLQVDMTTSREELAERMASLERETGGVVARTAALVEETTAQKKEMVRITMSVEARLGTLERSATELEEFIRGVQAKAREDVLDVKKIAQVSRANLLEMAARQDGLEESITQTKQEMKAEDGKLLELIGGLTIEVRSANEAHIEARAQLDNRLSAQLYATSEKVGELSTTVTAMSQDVGNMLMAVGSMPGQIHALELHMKQMTEEVTDSLVRMDKLDVVVADQEGKLAKTTESLEELRDSCFQLKEMDVQIDLTLQDTCKKVVDLEALVTEDREVVQNKLSGLEAGMETLSSTVTDFHSSATEQRKQDNDKTYAQLEKMAHDVDKLRRVLEEMPTASPLLGKKMSAGRLRSLTSGSGKVNNVLATGAGGVDGGSQPTSGRRPGSSSKSPRPASGSHAPRKRSPPSSRGSPRLDGLPSVISGEPSVHQESSKSGAGRPTSSSVSNNLRPHHDGAVDSESEDDGRIRRYDDDESDEDEDNTDDPIQDAARYFAELCLSFEEIAVKKTSIPDLNPALCDQITAVAQETSNHLAGTADAEIISRVLRAKPSEVTYDDMVSERRIALLSKFQAQIDKVVQEGAPSTPGIIRLEARELFIRKVRTALDIAMSKHEQVLVAAHSRLGRVAIPTCIACDRPLMNRHRHLQRSVYGDGNQDAYDLAEGSVSSLGRYDDESVLPIPTKEWWKMAPSQPVNYSDGNGNGSQTRPHTSVLEQRIVKRGSGFKMTRPSVTRSLDSLPSPVLHRTASIATS